MSAANRLALLAAACLLPASAIAQVSSTAQRVQGAGPASRGDPVNIRIVDCQTQTGAACPLATGTASATPTTAAGTSATQAVPVQGVTNGVPQNVALTAGTAIAGKLGIDQTTPGTTNAVTLVSGSGSQIKVDTTTSGNIASGQNALDVNDHCRILNGTNWQPCLGDNVSGQYTQERARSNYQLESTTNLAVSAVYTGAWRDMGVSPSASASFSCYARSDQVSGTAGFQLQISNDQTLTSVAQTATLAANASTVLSTAVFVRYARCVLTNSTTATTALYIASRSGQ